MNSFMYPYSCITASLLFLSLLLLFLPRDAAADGAAPNFKEWRKSFDAA
jgi:hypothetical protein